MHEQIVAELDKEIARLQKARELLNGRVPSPFAATAKKGTKKRSLSAASRAKIAAAQKARWAKQKKSAK